ncbi:MAG: ROK family protein [Phycisphaerales bacterium]
MPPSKPFVGVDLGGTNMQIGVVSPDGKLISQTKKKTKSEEGYEGVLDRICEGVTEACAAGGLSLSHIGGIGIGAPGVVDPHQGKVVVAVNLRWTNKPLADDLGKRLKTKVLVDNDVNVAVYGENVLGSGKNSKNLLGVWIGTGIGGGLILNGKLHYGHFLSAGEIGHIVLFPFHPLGSRTLENNASRTNVSNRIIKLINANYKSKLTSELGNDPEKWSREVKSKLIAQHYRGGEREDDLVVRVVDDAAEMIAVAIANAVTLLSLERVVLGGGLTEACGKAFVERVATHTREMVFPRICQDVELVTSKLEDSAGIYGAAMLAMDVL